MPCIFFTILERPETCLQISTLQPGLINKSQKKPKIMQNHYNSSKLLGTPQGFDSRAKRTAFGSPSTLPGIKSPPAKQPHRASELPSFGSDSMMGSPNNRYQQHNLKAFRSRPFLDNGHKALKTEGNPQDKRSKSKSNASIKLTSARTETTQNATIDHESRVNQPFLIRHRKISQDRSPSQNNRIYSRAKGESVKKQLMWASRANFNQPDKSGIDRNLLGFANNQNSQHKLKRMSIRKNTQCQFFQKIDASSILTNSDLLSQILQTIDRYPEKFGLVDAQVFKGIRSATEAVCYTEENKGRLANHLMDYMKQCQYRSHPELNHKVYRFYIEDFGKELDRFHRHVKSSNKNVLEVISSLSLVSNECKVFRDLKFDFNPTEMLNLSTRVRRYCDVDERAFIFLSNYLYLTLLKFEKKGKTLSELDADLKKSIKYIMDTLSFNEVIGQIKMTHKNQKSSNQIVYDQIILADDNEQKIESLVTAVIQKAKEAYMARNVLEQVIGIYSKFNCYNFFTELKITSQDDIMSIYEIIQQLCHKDKWKINPLERQALSKQKKSLKQIIQYQEQKYLNFYGEVCKRLGSNEKVIFNSSDLLKGVIRFEYTEDANKSINSLIKKSKKNQNFIELENNLTSQANPELKMKLFVGRTPAQIHSTVDFFCSHNEFFNKLHQIMNSSMTPITALKIMNERLTNKLMSQAKHYINHFSKQENAKHKKQIFDNIYPFEKLCQDFQAFEKTIGWKDPKYVSFDTEILQKKFMTIMADCKKFSILPEYKGKSKIKRNTADFYRTNRQFDKAIPLYWQLLRQIEEKCARQPEFNQDRFETYIMLADSLNCNGQIFPAIPLYKKNCDILHQISESEMMKVIHLQQNLAKQMEKSANYDGALENYQICLEKLKKIHRLDSSEGINILIDIANVNMLQKNYKEALERYNQCQIIVEKDKLKDSHIHATIMKNMSSVFGCMSNISKSISCLEKALKIENKLKGKGHVDKITSLNLMGAVHQQMGNYDLAISFYDRQIAIQQETRGKNNLISLTTRCSKAATLFRKGVYNQALKEYNKSLKIIEKRHGKDSLRYISVLKEIAEEYKTIKNYTEAISYYEQCYEQQSVYLKIPTIEKGYFRELIGGCQQKMGQMSKAKANYIQARQIYSESTDYERKSQSIRSVNKNLERIQEMNKRK